MKECRKEENEGLQEAREWNGECGKQENGVPPCYIDNWSIHTPAVYYTKEIES